MFPFWASPILAQNQRNHPDITSGKGPVTYFTVTTGEVCGHSFTNIERTNQPTTTLDYIFAGWRQIWYPERRFYLTVLVQHKPESVELSCNSCIVQGVHGIAQTWNNGMSSKLYNEMILLAVYKCSWGLWPGIPPIWNLLYFWKDNFLVGVPGFQNEIIYLFRLILYYFEPLLKVIIVHQVILVIICRIGSNKMNNILDKVISLCCQSWVVAKQ